MVAGAEVEDMEGEVSGATLMAVEGAMALEATRVRVITVGDVDAVVGMSLHTIRHRGRTAGRSPTLQEHRLSTKTTNGMPPRRQVDLRHNQDRMPMMLNGDRQRTTTHPMSNPKPKPLQKRMTASLAAGDFVTLPL